MKKLKKISRLFALSIAGLTLSAGALAGECPWLKAEVLNEAMPQYQPWTAAESSGAGHCRFEGETSRERGVRHQSPVLSLTQQIQPSAAAAADFAKALNQPQPLMKGYKVTATPTLGAHAFSYETGPDARTVSWVAHEGSQAFIASFAHHTPVSREDREQVQQVIAKAFKGSATPAARQDALSCPYFDPGLLKTLLPGAGLKVQRLGADSCMANTDASDVVLLNRFVGRTEAQTQIFFRTEASDGKGCQKTPQADLSASAVLVHGCTDGNPMARVVFNKGRAAFSISLVAAGKVPSPAQHQQLIALARSLVKNPAAN